MMNKLSRISNEHIIMLLELSYFRALTVEQYMEVEDTWTKSRAVRLYRLFGELIDMQLVTYAKPDQHVTKQRTHYLTKKGFDYVQNYLQLTPNRFGTGWRRENRSIYGVSIGHFDYETYTPPLKQYKHFYHATNTLIFFARFDIFECRNNLYAAQQYGSGKELKPDLELQTEEQTFFIEVDNSTENAQKLIDKFINYRDYFAHTTNTRTREPVIAFVCPNLPQEVFNRRQTIIEAAYNKVFADTSICTLTVASERFDVLFAYHHTN